MKKLFILLFLVPVLVLNAQEEESTEKTLFGGKDVRVTGYGAPDLLFSQILGNETGLFMGGRGGVILNSSLILGGGGYGLATKHTFDYKDPINGDSMNAYFNMGYGGLHIGYVNSSDDVVHYTLSTLIGAGGASYNDGAYYKPGSWEEGTLESTAFFVLQPAVGIELNMLSFFRVEATVGYRLSLWSTLSHHGDTDLSGIFAGLALKFGKF